MNLIEELGGYYQAKAIRCLPADTFDCGVEFNREELNLAMLEYRRANNIFEVCDWVFPLIRIVDEIEGVGRFICADKGELVVIREMKSKGAYCSHEHRLDNSFYMAFSEFRHATNEEIKAGRRL